MAVLPKYEIMGHGWVIILEVTLFSDLPSYSCLLKPLIDCFPIIVCAPLLMSSGDLENESIPLFHTKKSKMPKNRRDLKQLKRFNNDSISMHLIQVMPSRPDVAASSMPRRPF